MYRVAAALMVRGMNVYFPAIDNGVDLVTATGLRIQVKSSRAIRRAMSKDHLTYGFRLGSATKGAQRTFRIRPRAYADEVDFFVLWGIDEDRFWIAPSSVFDKRSLLLLVVGRSTSYSDFARTVYEGENRWDLLLPQPAAESPLKLVAGGDGGN